MTAQPSTRRRWKWALSAAALVVLSAAGIRGARSALSAVADSPEVTPTVRVTSGSFDIRIHMRGDIRAGRQQAVTAPPTGGALRILDMVESGQVVNQGGLLVAFDPADQLYNLEQAESELREAEQTIIRRRAEIEAQTAADQVALLSARFNVRRAELDARVDEDLIPANEYRIRQVSLDEARRALAQTEQDVEARTTVNRASLSVLGETRAKAQLAAEQARQNLQMLEVRAPIDGVVSVRENVDSTNVFYSGMTLPPYRVGDLVNAGRPLIDLFDMSGLEIRGTVSELDRVNLAVGQTVTVTSPGVPGVEFPAAVEAVSNMSQPAQRYMGPLRRFDVTIGLAEPDARLRPGAAVDLVVMGPRVESALTLPRQAIFEEDGRTISFVRTAAGFEARAVKVVHRGEVNVAVEGLDAGTEVALVRPAAAAALSTDMPVAVGEPAAASAARSAAAASPAAPAATQPAPFSAPVQRPAAER